MGPGLLLNVHVESFQELYPARLVPGQVVLERFNMNIQYKRGHFSMDQRPFPNSTSKPQGKNRLDPDWPLLSAPNQDKKASCPGITNITKKMSSKTSTFSPMYTAPYIKK
ncbi:hypothetical protein DSO57_1033703 [Entomophthora muscae]|uniref:Uncharacterized protein n=1 Tax=Entomophthora muscae TaxID=34485 RepID=A0ACC2RQW3_9FUNG|nr:hypothetical protein DSO57_1033703 [Entomophthora muscae]